MTCPTILLLVPRKFQPHAARSLPAMSLLILIRSTPCDRNSKGIAHNGVLRVAEIFLIKLTRSSICDRECNADGRGSVTETDSLLDRY